MSDGNFAGFITSERERLSGERQQIVHEQRELEQKLDAITKEFAAIEAYEAAKTGRSVRSGGASGTRPRAARRGSKREEIISVIRDGNGLSRGEIIEKMGLKGDKSGEMSISNALTALVKNSQVRREGGKYLAA